MQFIWFFQNIDSAVQLYLFTNDHIFKCLVMVEISSYSTIFGTFFEKIILNVNERLGNDYVNQWNGQQANTTMKLDILIVFFFRPTIQLIEDNFHRMSEINHRRDWFIWWSRSHTRTQTQTIKVWGKIYKNEHIAQLNITET